MESNNGEGIKGKIDMDSENDYINNEFDCEEYLALLSKQNQQDIVLNKEKTHERSS